MSRSALHPEMEYDGGDELKPPINDFATTAVMMGSSDRRRESLSQAFGFLGGGLHRHAVKERI